MNEEKFHVSDFPYFYTLMSEDTLEKFYYNNMKFVHSNCISKTIIINVFKIITKILRIISK